MRRRREALIEEITSYEPSLSHLAEGWTPQISGWLKGGNERRLRAVSCETIYALSFGQPKGPSSCGVISRDVTKPPATPIETFARYHQDGVSIHERPKTVDGRTEGGHWEGDLIICKRTRPVLVLHERKSRVTLAARLAGKTAAETISVMLAVFLGSNPRCASPSLSTIIPPSLSTPCYEPCAP